MFKYRDSEPPGGEYFIAVDLAGFSTEGTHTRKELKVRDETAIAIVKVFPTDETTSSKFESFGWWVKEIRHGQWDARQTAFQIVKAAKDHKVQEVGIEKGALMYAVQGYLAEYCDEYRTYLNFRDLTHGNRKKADRVRWALEGRASKGRIFLKPGPWNEEFIDQACGFPSNLVHDDLLDAVAYIDQMAENMIVPYDIDYLNTIRAEPMDDIMGY
jgi:Terminase RNaseH-like domain